MQTCNSHHCIVFQAQKQKASARKENLQQMKKVSLVDASLFRIGNFYIKDNAHACSLCNCGSLRMEIVIHSFYLLVYTNAKSVVLF